MVTAPCTKDPVTAKIDNVASRGIVCFPQKSSEIVLRQITQDRDSPRAVHPRYVSELIERKTRNAKAQQPPPARAGENRAGCTLVTTRAGLRARRSTKANDKGGHGYAHHDLA